MFDFDFDYEKGYCLCRRCIDYLKSRGEKIYVGDCVIDYDASVEENLPCHWCDEFADLFEVL